MNTRIEKIAYSKKSGIFLIYFGNLVISTGQMQEEDMLVLIASIGPTSISEGPFYVTYKF